MKTDKIKEGLQVDNYKSMCSLLEEELKTGNSKKSQLNNWNRYFLYHKKGHKFIIDKVYDKPLEEINKGIYIEEIKKILINYIYNYNQKTSSNTVHLSFSKLINILGLVNNTYTVADYKKKELSDILNISLQAINFFYNSSKGAFKDIIKSSLNSLKNKSIIEYSMEYMICEKIESLEGKLIKNYRLATEEEVSIILDSQNKVLNDMNIKDLQELRLSGISKYREFNKLVMKELKKDVVTNGIVINPREYWVFYYRVYSITYGKNAVAREYDKIVNTRKQLNNKSINRLNTKLAISTDKENEKKLIDVLIDLVKYDSKLDDKLEELYKENKSKAYSKSFNEILLSKELEEQSKKTLEDFENRNNVNDYDIYLYKQYIENRKNLKDIIDIEEFHILDDLFN